MNDNLFKKFIELGINNQEAHNLATKVSPYLELPPEIAWQSVSHILSTSSYPFHVHLYLFAQIYPEWQIHPEKAPAWLPDENAIKKMHLWQCMQKQGFHNRVDFHRWTREHYSDFWEMMIQKLGIVFQKQPTQLCDLSQGIESPSWLPGAVMNIAESCFTAPSDTPALIFLDKNQHLSTLSYSELNALSNRIAHSLIHQGFHAGDAAAIIMPMTVEAVALYLGIIKMGGVVVSIADSFSSDAMALRLQAVKTRLVFTQDIILRGRKKLPLYQRTCQANAPATIVIPAEEMLTEPLRAQDCSWADFLVKQDEDIHTACTPMSPINILFSSGTTGTPKAIPWNHTTAIKAASDAYLHHDIQPADVLAWPTNLGWMMGPWLIFASLINRATLALYTDIPTERTFGQFVQDAGVTMLGIVPTIVASWQQSQCMENLNWQKIKVFSSTGECSNAEEMLYLMSLAGYKPIIEYCGGTEIGGSYITSTLVEENYPSLFTTPAMGLDFVLLDETGTPTDNGEIALIPPSVGLSTALLNADHHKTYFAEMPRLPDGRQLRRHGDQAKRLSNGCYTLLGRADDTMNLGGIKISSAEIERAMADMDEILETAAIAVTFNNHGPDHLVIYAVPNQKCDKLILQKKMQTRINQLLNPLFKIHDVVFVKSLPKTVSNKIMRRSLRAEYTALLHSK